MRSRGLWFVGVGAAVLLAAGSPASVEAADRWSPILEVEVAYGRSPAALGVDIEQYVYTGSIGDTLLIVGRVTEFHGPLADLDAAGSREYTLFLHGLVGTGSAPWDGFGEDWGAGGVRCEYQGGRFLLLDDDSPDATPASVDSYRDGVVLLAGDLSWAGLWEGSGGTKLFRDIYAGGAFKEGERLSSLGTDAIAPEMQLSGTFKEESPWWDLGVSELGYFATFTFTVEAYLPVAVRPTTWGRLKTLYTTQAP